MQSGVVRTVHKAWFISDFENKDQALRIIPSFLRHNASIIELVKFSKTDMLDLTEHE
jgi:hypothetical protein